MSGVRIEIQVTSGPATGRRFQLDRPDSWVCGRAKDVQLSLAGDTAISRHHFKLEFNPPEVRLTDLGSRNGTYVNGLRYGGSDPATPDAQVAPGSAISTLLRDRDEIAAGASRMRLLIIDPATAARCPLCASVLGPDEEDTLCHECVETLKVHPFQKVRRMLLNVLERITGVDHPELPGFDITGELGHGGMARVYRAVNRRTGAVVAIKVILPEMAKTKVGMGLFKREIEVNRQLKHPNIVELYYSAIGHGACFFIMEYVDGTTLEEHVATRGGKLPLAAAAPLFVDVLDGLGYAHRAQVLTEVEYGGSLSSAGVVHRDLKPTNILVHRGLDRWHAKIADFGLAKAFGTAGHSGLTSAGAVHGTPAYWPREQLLFFRYLSPPSDVFSAASVFYQVLTGTSPRSGVQELIELCRVQNRLPTIPDFVKLIIEQPIVPLRTRDPSLPRHVCAVLDRALAEPKLEGDEGQMRETLRQVRYRDGRAFRDAFVKALEDDGILLETPVRP